MNTRILPPEEWARIKTRELTSLLPYVQPENAQVVAVEAGEDIVATMCALRVTHFEGLWIDSRHRNPGIVRSLMRETWEVPRSRGEQWAFGGAWDGDKVMGSICSRLGKPLDLKFYVLPVGG